MLGCSLPEPPPCSRCPRACRLWSAASRPLCLAESPRSLFPSMTGAPAMAGAPSASLPSLAGALLSTARALTSRAIRPFMFFGVTFLDSGAPRSAARGSLRFVVARMLFGALVLLACGPRLFLAPGSRRFVAPRHFSLAPGTLSMAAQQCSGASTDLALFGRFSFRCLAGSSVVGHTGRPRVIGSGRGRQRTRERDRAAYEHGHRHRSTSQSD